MNTAAEKSPENLASTDILRAYVQIHKVKTAPAILKTLKHKDSYTWELGVTKIASVCNYFDQRTVSFQLTWSSPTIQT